MRTSISLLLLVAACGGVSRTGSPGTPAPEPGAARTVQPGAPGEPTRTLRPGEVAPRGTAAAAPADIHFLHGMIPHHAQALEMAALVESRDAREEIRLIAGRIALSQRDEINLMQRWLAGHGAPPGDEHAHHAQGEHPFMPGMLTRADMDRLTAARGAAFDRLFLEYMIRHHEGALVMVADLLRTPGAAEDAELYQFAAHVDADQQMEIERMRRLLATLP